MINFSISTSPPRVETPTTPNDQNYQIIRLSNYQIMKFIKLCNCPLGGGRELPIRGICEVHMELGKGWKGRDLQGRPVGFHQGATWRAPPRISIFRHQGPDWPCEGGEIIKLSNYQISKLTKAGSSTWGKRGRGGKSQGRPRVFRREATWPRFPRIGVFLHQGPVGSPGGGIIKLSNQQIIKLAN